MIDRYGFIGRAAQPGQKTPIRAELPATAGEGVAVLRLYDPIDSVGGDWGVSAKEFAAALDGLAKETREIRVHINSPGGEVFEAITILNMLRSHPARVVTVVDGVAASAAGVVAMAGDEVVMAQNTELMIHDAWGVCVGGAQDMRDVAGRLDQLSANIAEVYAAKAGGPVEDWLAAMAAETWYMAQEAVDAGLADRVEPSAPKVNNRFDLSMFNYAGRSKAPAPPIPAASASGHTEIKQEESMSLADDLRARLGIADDSADEATILAALDEALAEHADPPATLPEGIVAIDAAQLAELQAQAREGMQARAQQQAEHRERLVAAAVLDGRIPPARRDHWLAQLQADPGAEQVLVSLAPGLVPLAEIGYGNAPEASDDDALYASLFGKGV